MEPDRVSRLVMRTCFRQLWRIGGSALLLAVGIAALIGQGRHYMLRGHLAPFGLHADVQWDEAELAPGWRPRLHWVEVTNFGIWPTSFIACRYETDTLSPGMELAWALQRWNDRQRAWEVRELPGERDWCDPRPFPTSRGPARISSKRLWPGETARAMLWEVVRARGDFELGASARFVVFRSLSEPERWNTAVTSPPFRVEGEPSLAH